MKELALPSEHDGNVRLFGNLIGEQLWEYFDTTSLDGINPRINFRYDLEHGRIIIHEAFATGAEDDDRVSPQFIKEEIQIFCSESGVCMVEFASDVTIEIYKELP